MYLSKKKKCHKLYSEMKVFLKQNSQINTHVLRYVSIIKPYLHPYQLKTPLSDSTCTGQCLG